MSERRNDFRESDRNFFSSLFGSLTPEQLDRVERGVPKLAFEDEDEPTRAVAPGDELSSTSEKLAKAKPEQNLFVRDDVSPRVYIDWLTKRYKAAWLQWEEPETLWQTIERDVDLPVKGMSRVAQDKIQVARSLMHQPTIFEEAPAFENAVQAWCDILSNVSVLEKVTPNEIIYFLELHGRLFKPKPFGHDVRKYIVGIFGEDGWFMMPPQLLELQQDLDDYNTLTMDPKRLATLKQRFLAKLQGRQKMTDNDTDPASVQMARLQKAGLFIRNRDEREKRQRSKFDVTPLKKAEVS